jgi:hypothetical protein
MLRRATMVLRRSVASEAPRFFRSQFIRDVLSLSPDDRPLERVVGTPVEQYDCDIRPVHARPIRFAAGMRRVHANNY